MSVRVRVNLRIRRRGNARAAWLGALALLACAVFAVTSATALGASTPTIALSIDNTSPAAGATVTMTALVTNADGVTNSSGGIQGTVNFFNGSVQLNDLNNPVQLTLISPTQFRAVFKTSFAAGSYAITAAYRKGVVGAASTPPVTLTVGHVDLHPTTSTLTANPSVVVPGEPVTLTATVSEVNGSRTPTGLVTFDDNGIPFTGGEVPLDANGQATLTVDGFQPGPHVIHASYAGDAVDKAFTTGLDLNVPATPQAVNTAIEVSVTPQFIHEGDTVTIVAHVHQEGQATTPAAGAIVSFTANGVPLHPGSAALDANGNATIVVTGGWQSGVNYDIQASYVGSDLFNPSTGNASLSVLAGDQPLAQPTQVTYTGATSGVYGSSVQLAALLTSGTAPVAGELVTLTLGAQTCSALTGSNGRATCSLTLTQMPGNYTVNATFGGDGQRLSSSTSHSFAIDRQATTLTYTGATSADYKDATTLSATLLDASGNGLTGKSVMLTLGSLTCPATTGPGGIAACTVAQVTLVPGSYTVTASFAGDAIYLPAPDATASFQVQRETTASTVAAVNAVAAGSVQLRGTLLEDGLPLAGQTVNLSLGSTTCNAVTNDSGIATCNVVAATLGPAAVGISFAGNTYYVESSATIQNGALVYTYAPGTGSFVIGDGNSAPGTSVTFWGAKWAKLNKVSGGSAPDAFKGYAAQGSKACGTGWSTAPGNSSSPPAGPLPAYMAVLVTSSVGKSGPTISGSTAHIVVVKIDGGYKNDPGHAGTGTVVATVC